MKWTQPPRLTRWRGANAQRQGGSGVRGGDQRRRNEDEDLVLQHVRAEELLAEFVDGRNQRERKGEPAGIEARVPPAQSMHVPRRKSSCRVDDQQSDERKHDGRLPAPGHSTKRSVLGLRAAEWRAEQWMS